MYIGMKVINILLDFLVPMRCSICGRKDILSKKVSVCRKCFVPEKPEGRVNECPVCKTALVEGNCVYCTTRNVFFTELFYIRTRNLLEKKLIHRVKFGNEPNISNFFRIGLNRTIRSILHRKFTSIVYIPSGKKTRKERPYYFCDPIIQKLTKKMRIPTICPFEKVSGELQSGKSYMDRFLHASRAFEITEPYKNNLQGVHLLVDDIFTTGATVNELSKLLLMNGATEVYLLMLTRVK
jgi:competence protein ComFC